MARERPFFFALREDKAERKDRDGKAGVEISYHGADRFGLWDALRLVEVVRCRFLRRWAMRLASIWT